MKKFYSIAIVTLISMMFSVSSYAQLNLQTQEDAAGYKTVWEYNGMYGGGCIRYMERTGVYVLLGPTNNRYEDTMASIALGDTKESALKSLEDLEKIINKEIKLPKGGFIVKAYGRGNTTIYRSNMTWAIKEDYVAGESYVLHYIGKKMNDVKEAINNFNEPTES